jgi:type I restriction enzyme, S subunit
MTEAARNLLEQHFDTAFAAPDGVAKLRELILTLAMQGKLVEQDPDDPPASQLLKEIETEKQRLVKAGKIKKPKPLPPIKPEEVPYALPQGWEWVRFGDIAVIERGGSPRPIKAFLTDDSNGLNWIKIGDTDQGGKYITSTREKIRPEGLLKTRMVYPGDFLLTNSMSFGRPYITQIEGCIHDGWLRISPPESLEKDYLYHLLSSSFIRRMFEAAAAGAVVLNLNSDKVRELPIPLPPIPEQYRIVARIDQLIPRCDELERLRKEREEKRIAVHASAIKQLLDAQDGSAWDFIQEHFGELYTVKENVAELRKAILQLAVMGRLVPQDPNDPPASKLLKEIEAEKQRLVKEKKIKRPKPIPSISQDDEPFQIPDNWRWVRIAELAESIDYGTSQKTCDDSSLVPVYRMGNIVDGQLIDEGFKYIAPDIDELPRLFLQPNDILFNRTNSYELVGKSARYTGPVEHATFASYLIRVRLFDALLNPVFISQAMNAPYFRSTQIEPEIVQQCGQANFNGTKLSLCAVPLPPLPEQHRIVARTDQLMALCDTLDQQIDAATEKQTALLNAVMAHV